MKLIYCTNCDTSFTPSEERKECICGKSSAVIIDGIVNFSGTYCSPGDFNHIPEQIEDKTAVFILHDVNLKTKKLQADKEFYVKVIEYLNDKAESDFSLKFPSANSKLVLDRRNEHKSTLQDFFKIIDKKVAQWKGTEFQIYLRPVTLFNKTKFINYAGETRTIKATDKSGFNQLAGSAGQAKANIIARGDQS